MTDRPAEKSRLALMMRYLIGPARQAAPWTVPAPRPAWDVNVDSTVRVGPGRRRVLVNRARAGDSTTVTPPARRSNTCAPTPAGCAPAVLCVTHRQPGMTAV